ncbi:cupin domain-containing protein [Pseudoroseicyclus sp. CXY001]|uniref:cupin domain-containing protein n=1 Tax=Pseudoroseicyclus sp. CXY001 TaxID=3242492 RepID=UPI0035717142
MAIFRKADQTLKDAGASYPAPYTLPAGRMLTHHLTERGGLTQFGVVLQQLQPGGQSSQMHWESHEDEFLYVLDGRLTVVEDGVETEIGPGDSACWPAGVAVAHCLRNHSDAPATYLVAGTRDEAHNICTYPGLDMLATPAGRTHADGTPYREPDPKGETS